LSANNATPVNVGAANIKGLEAEFEIRPIGGLQFDGSRQLSELQLHVDQSERSGADPQRVAQYG